MGETESRGDWYCRNCGYLSSSRVTYYETCDTCHQPVEWHSLDEMTTIAAQAAEIERLREALRKAEDCLGDGVRVGEAGLIIRAALGGDND